ncbi:uncharacterized protein [Typha latifolia]|uniref:uncharacterized protein n=1 Tax=Typha latifolia TaxID=4733 RepID=UPI003C2EEC41
MGRAPCCDKANVKKGPWSPDEDAKLKSYIEEHGTGGNWIALPQKIGLKRCGKSCRLRWLNYLRPNLKHGGFSEEEDSLICSLYINIGSRWSIIAAQLPGRTDNDIKNYWNTRLKKKLLGKQRKDHQPKGRRTASGGGDHEAKRDEVENFATTCDTYWPVPTVSVHLNTGVQSSSLQPPPPPLAYDESNSTSLATPSTHFTTFDDGFAMELDEIFHFNQVKLEGLDGFYEEGDLVDEVYRRRRSSSSATFGSMNWSEVSPLMYPNMVTSFEGMKQCLFEETMLLGKQ